MAFRYLELAESAKELSEYRAKLGIIRRLISGTEINL